MVFSFRFEFQEPADAFVQNAGIERVNDELAALFSEDQVGLAEQIEMMGNGGFADLEMLGNGAGGEVTAPEEFEDFPTGRIVEGFENRVHTLIVRQLSKYSARLSRVEV